MTDDEKLQVKLRLRQADLEGRHQAWLRAHEGLEQPLLAELPLTNVVMGAVGAAAVVDTALAA